MAKTKIRVHEVAKQLSVSSKDVMDVLKEIGIEVRSVQTGIDEEAAQKVVKILIKRSVQKDAEKQREARAKEQPEKAAAQEPRKSQASEQESQRQASKKEDAQAPARKPSQKQADAPAAEPAPAKKSVESVPVRKSAEAAPVRKPAEAAPVRKPAEAAPVRRVSDEPYQQKPARAQEQPRQAERPLRKDSPGQSQTFADRPTARAERSVPAGVQPRQGLGDRTDRYGQPGGRAGQASGDRQQRPFGQDRPGQPGGRTGQASGDRQQRPFGQDRPGQPGGRPGQGFGDRQQRPFGQDRPGQPGGRPGQGFGDRQQRPFGQDRPGQPGGRSGQGFGDRQQRPFGQDRPGQGFGDRQQRPFGQDRPGGQFRQGGGYQGGQGRTFMDKDKDARTDRRPSGQGQRKSSSSSFDLILPQKTAQSQNQKQKQKHDEKKEQQITAKGRMLIQQGMKSSLAKKRSEAKRESVPEAASAIEVALPITIGEFASLMSIKPGDILRKLLENGRMLAINHSLDKDLIFFIMDLFEMPHERIFFKEDVDSEEEEADDERFMVPRPPVVTILGHVDHGKTSLLDAIRKTNVTAGEAGGITQKIGAYVVEHDSRKIVFVDTPGHEAFTAMRARGAQVTDIAILVVAADDGVMPQTVEAINHAKAAKVPIIVAINKIDKPGANIDRVKQQLADQGLIPEDWGGDVICVPVSAKARQGLGDLLEMIILVADMQELKANPKRRACGVILESRLDKGLGCMATVLVQKGTLKPGDSVIAGLVSGKVRLLINENGEKVKKATPSIPVEIVGLTDLPNAGDVLMAVKDDKMARQISDERQTRDRERHLVSGPRTTLQDIFKGLSEGEKKELDVLIKADSNGSVEAIKHSLAKLPDDEVKVNVVHGAVGTVSESDVLLAKTSSHPLIIGFNIRVEPNIKKLAEQEKVNIRTYDVIYHMIEDIQAAMKGMLEPEYELVLIGKAEVRQIFKASKIGVIAGSFVVSGKVARSSDVKIYRNRKLIHEGKIESLKRFKDDAKEVLEGFECGISIEGFNDIEVGDVIEAYQLKEKDR